MKEIFISNWDVILLLLWWIVSFLWWIKQFYLKQKQEVEVEKLKAKLEFEKDKWLLNDKKFREAYNIFISSIIKFIKSSKEKKNNDKILNEAVNNIYEFIQIAILYSSSETIKSFWEYKRVSSWWENSIEVIKYMWKVLLCMRKDVWAENTNLDEFDILQTFVNWDVRKEFNS